MYSNTPITLRYGLMRYTVGREKIPRIHDLHLFI